MQELRKMLNEAIEQYGLTHSKVLEISKELEVEICQEQRKRLESEIKCY